MGFSLLFALFKALAAPENSPLFAFYVFFYTASFLETVEDTTYGSLHVVGGEMLQSTSVNRNGANGVMVEEGGKAKSL